MKSSVLLTIVTSASASLCCIVPVLGLIGGSSSLMANVSWIEPFRPYFIGGTFLLLGFAWYRSIKSTKADDCGCEPTKASFLQSRKFLAGITILSLMLISFPSYSKYIIQNANTVAAGVDQDKNKKLTLGVNGMTCSSCEHHIESEVIKLSGVSSVKASYANKSATIEFDALKTDEEKIIAAINSTGYTVDSKVNLLQEKSKADCCSKGSCTPGSCTNMPQVSVPSERSKNLKVLSNLDDLKGAFNKQMATLNLWQYCHLLVDGVCKVPKQFRKR